MSKFQATVNFEKLNEVPYMKNFSGNPKFQMMVSEFIEDRKSTRLNSSHRT